MQRKAEAGEDIIQYGVVIAVATMVSVSAFQILGDAAKVWLKPTEYKVTPNHLYELIDTKKAAERKKEFEASLYGAVKKKEEPLTEDELNTLINEGSEYTE